MCCFPIFFSLTTITEDICTNKHHRPQLRAHREHATGAPKPCPTPAPTPNPKRAHVEEERREKREREEEEDREKGKEVEEKEGRKGKRKLIILHFHCVYIIYYFNSKVVLI